MMVLKFLFGWLTNLRFSSVQSLDRQGRRRDMRNDSAEILFQSFLQETLLSTVGMWAGVSTLGFVKPAFSLPTIPSSTLQGALKDGFGEAVMACDMSEPCKFPSLDSC